MRYATKCAVCGKRGETQPHRIHKHGGHWVVSQPGDVGTHECCRACWLRIFAAFQEEVRETTLHKEWIRAVG